MISSLRQRVLWPLHSAWRRRVLVTRLLIFGFGMQLVVCGIGSRPLRSTPAERLAFLPRCDFVDRIEGRIGIDSSWTITFSIERSRFSDVAVTYVYPPVDGVVSAADPAYPQSTTDAPEDALPALVLVRTVGWPVRAFDGAAGLVRGPSSVPDWSIVSVPWWGSTLQFPLLPRPLGIAANTVFFAVAIGGAYALAGAARRRVRRSRGLCPTCAYPCPSSLRVESERPCLVPTERYSRCPECGTFV